MNAALERAIFGGIVLKIVSATGEVIELGEFKRTATLASMDEKWIYISLVLPNPAPEGQQGAFEIVRYVRSW